MTNAMQHGDTEPREESARFVWHCRCGQVAQQPADTASLARSGHVAHVRTVASGSTLDHLLVQVFDPAAAERALRRAQAR